MLDTIYSSKLLSSVACWATRLLHRDFPREIEKRSKLNLFDYKGIAQPLPKYYQEILTDNNSFGIGYWLRKYSNINANHINSFVEHGYFWGEYASTQEQQTFAKQILTFGEVRKKHIEAKIKDKTVIPIGPYIHYASDFYDKEKTAQLKDKLGRVLLVFFSHAATGCSVNFDEDYLISKIEEVKSGFDTVIISLFWSDINPEWVAKLEKHHYIVFSSGHRYDPYFMSRQKTVISLADATMSNNIGTHIAYCTYMGKPHWIVKQEITYSSKDGAGNGNLEAITKIKSDNQSAAEKNELMDTFSSYSETLSDEQVAVASKYFGFDYVKSPEEMYKVLLEK